MLKARSIWYNLQSLSTAYDDNVKRDKHVCNVFIINPLLPRLAGWYMQMSGIQTRVLIVNVFALVSVLCRMHTSRTQSGLIRNEEWKISGKK